MKHPRSTKETGSAGAPPAVSGAPPGTSGAHTASGHSLHVKQECRPRGRERQRAGAPALPEIPQERRSHRASKASKDWLWFDPDSAIERETEVIVPLWTAECIVREASAWLGAELPEDWPAALAAKAERCFAKHRQFHRLICSEADGGDAGIANLRKFMRHWLCSWLKRTRLALYRRLPWEYALGAPLKRR